MFVFRRVLEKCGLSSGLRIARNGQEALLYLRDLARDEKARCPALVLLDLNLPKIAGIEVLRELRSSPRCNRTPVIVVTSSTAEADRAAVEHLGAEAYFQKPTGLAAYMELVHIIRRVLQDQGPT